MSTRHKRADACASGRGMNSWRERGVAHKGSRPGIADRVNELPVALDFACW